MIVYDNRFNANEWSIIAGLVAGALLVVLLPKRFPRKIAIVFFMCGVYSGFFFDHSLSTEPVSFYDVNDVNKYQVMDFLSYWVYGPISYLFFYIYDCLRPKSSRIPIYILVWSIAAVGIEGIAVLVGIFHYRLGYKLYYSFPIYLIVQSCWMLLYYRMTRLPLARRQGE